MAVGQHLSNLNPDGTCLGQSTADKIGFYGLATPLAQQASTVDLGTQLANLGLVPSGTAYQGAGLVNVTAATLTVTAAAHAGRVVALNRAAGTAVTLPAATGTGLRYEFLVGTTVTSNTTTVKAASASDAFVGNAWVGSDNSAAALWYVAAAGTDDTVTLNGTTTGGYAGHRVLVTDVAAGTFSVESFGKATGTEATPFSATV